MAHRTNIGNDIRRLGLRGEGWGWAAVFFLSYSRQERNIAEQNTKMVEVEMNETVFSNIYA